MRKYLKVFWWWMLMRVEITVPYKPNEYYMRYKTTFALIPRKVPCFFSFLIIATPILFLTLGFRGVKYSWKDVFKKISSTSMNFIADDEPYVPTKFECYSKF